MPALDYAANWSLQRGRRTDAAEGLVALPRKRVCPRLQRGRRTDAAEGGRAEPSRSSRLAIRFASNRVPKGSFCIVKDLGGLRALTGIRGPRGRSQRTI